ncbi:MAG: AzlC family ABC transporter permease [Spirochaetes bacterium]|nr:AzlC family ABC transporter permease [Spirochaetota bacterium]
MSKSKREFIEGMRDCSPLVLGAVPFGIIFGTLAIQNGLTFGQTMALSLIVFAGSAQFVAVGLFAAGASPQVLILTTFVVNLRHVLYAATLAPKTRHLSGTVRALMAFVLTDESFAVSAARYTSEKDPEYRHCYYFGASLLMYVNWQLCSLIGALFGKAIPGASQWGLDFAMPVAFIGMLVPYLRTVSFSVAAVTAGLVSVITYSWPNRLGLVIAAFAGILTGYLVFRVRREGVA